MPETKATVSVPRTWFEQCYLPGVCIKTGVDTTETRELSAEYHNPVAWVGLLFGVIGVLLADLILVKKSAGRVPYADAAGNEQRRNTGIIISTVGGCMFLGVFSGMNGLMALGLIGLIVLFAGLMHLFKNRRLGVQPSMSSDQMMVTIKNVHPRFAAATTDLLNRARQAEQPAPAPFDPNALQLPHATV